MNLADTNKGVSGSRILLRLDSRGYLSTLISYRDYQNERSNNENKIYFRGVISKQRLQDYEAARLCALTNDILLETPHTRLLTELNESKTEFFNHEKSNLYHVLGTEVDSSDTSPISIYGYRREIEIPGWYSNAYAYKYEKVACDLVSRSPLYG